MNKTILFCAAIAIGFAYFTAPDWAFWVISGAILFLAVGMMAIVSPTTIFGPYDNEDIYDKDFTSLDDVPKPVVKIDEHC